MRCTIWCLPYVAVSRQVRPTDEREICHIHNHHILSSGHQVDGDSALRIIYNKPHPRPTNIRKGTCHQYFSTILTQRKYI